jgi:hypothetical protein
MEAKTSVSDLFCACGIPIPGMGVDVTISWARSWKTASLIAWNLCQDCVAFKLGRDSFLDI